MSATATQTPATAPDIIRCSGGCGQWIRRPANGHKDMTYRCVACCRVKWEEQHPPPVEND